MRHISFFLTTPQIVDESKTVTRRLGWQRLKVGELLQPIVKGQGLKKGEKVQRLPKRLRVVSVTREPLNAITPSDVIREGFPGLSVDEFIAMFCRSHRGCTPTTAVTRMEFTYVHAPE